MDNIKEIVHQVMKGLSVGENSDSEQINEIWDSILEKGERHHLQLTGVKDGKISISVDSPATLYQMKIKKSKLLSQLKEHIPQIEDINFRIGKIS